MYVCVSIAVRFRSDEASNLVGLMLRVEPAALVAVPLVDLLTDVLGLIAFLLVDKVKESGIALKFKLGRSREATLFGMTNGIGMIVMSCLCLPRHVSTSDTGA